MDKVRSTAPVGSRRLVASLWMKHFLQPSWSGSNPCGSSLRCRSGWSFLSSRSQQRHPLLVIVFSRKKDWIAWHAARSQRCHSRRRPRSSSPNFNSARRSVDGSEKKCGTCSPTHERSICNSTAENSPSAQFSLKSRHRANLSPRFPFFKGRKKKDGQGKSSFRRNIIRTKMSIHNFDHMVKKRTWWRMCVDIKKWKAMLSHAHASGDLVSRAGVYVIDSSFSRFDITLTISCVKMCCHLTFARIQKEQLEGQNCDP